MQNVYRNTFIYVIGGTEDDFNLTFNTSNIIFCSKRVTKSLTCENPQTSEMYSCSLQCLTFLAFQMECFRFDWSPTWSISAPVPNHLHQLGRNATRELLISVPPKSLGRRIYTLLSLFQNNFSFQKWFPIFSILKTHLIQGNITVEGKLNKGWLLESQWNLKI